MYHQSNNYLHLYRSLYSNSQTSWAGGAQNGNLTMSAWRQRVAGSTSGSGTDEADAEAEDVTLPVLVVGVVGVVVVADAVVAAPLSPAADDTADSSWSKAPDANSSATAAGR